MAALNAEYGCAPTSLVTFISGSFALLTPMRNVGVLVAWSRWGVDDILLDRLCVLSGREALLEGRHVQPDPLRVFDQIVAAELALIRKEPIVHLSVLALI